MTRFITEQQILIESFRAEVIKEIVHSPENLARKAAELKKDEIYNDQNKKWVMYDVMAEGYKPETVAQMGNRATNISFAKKIVNKLSKTYTGGVERKIKTADGKPASEEEQKKLDEMADELDFNTKMRDWDRKRQLHRNTLLKIVPYLDTRQTRLTGKPKFEVELRALAPWQYDVIEDPANREKPAVVILSEFYDRDQFERPEGTVGANGERIPGWLSPVAPDGKDQIIADSPSDYQKEMADRRFIWWSDTYHFTTDGNGKIVSAPDLNLNPIKRLPFVNQAGNQNGAYWATGGQDVTDGSVLINKQLTDVNFISFIQGWGQMVIAAKNIPKKLVGGPDNAFMFEKSDATETVEVFFATSNPPIEKHLETVRMALAMLLSSNGLSTRHIAAKLDVVTAPSALSMMVEDAEVIADTKEVQSSFQDAEPNVWTIINLWWLLYQPNKWLVEDQQRIEPLKETNVSTKYFEQKPPTTEKEKLDALKMRKEIGLDTMVGLLKRDNPDLTDEEAKVKAKEIMDEKKALAPAISPQGPNNQAGKGEEDGLNPDDNQDASPPNEDDDNA